LSLASYGLLRRLRLDRGLAALLVALATLMVSVLLVGGRLRVTPDLPALSLGFTGAVTALLATDVLRQNLRRRLSPPAYEWAGALLSALLLLGGLLAFQALTGYTGVYPLMARLGPALSWALVLPLLLYAAWATLVLRLLRGAGPPPAWLAVGLCWLAA